MTIRIVDFRISFLWFADADLLFEDPVPDVPAAFLGTDAGYVERLEALRAGAQPAGVRLPWPEQPGKTFWSMYLGHAPDTVSPWKAWKHFVPLRQRPAVNVSAPGLPGSSSVEGYLYPHGIAVVAEVNLFGGAGSGWDPIEAAEVAHQVRFDKVFELADADGAPAAAKLEAVGTSAIRSLWRSAYGGEPVPALHSPYTVTTFVRLRGDPADAAPVEGGEVHRMLEAVTRWRTSGWQNAALPPLAEAGIDSAGGTPGHLHYARRQGRAAWYPTHALDAPRGLRRMRCYHHNQVLAALQVESLGSLVHRSAARVRNGEALVKRAEDAARHTVGLLGRMYGPANPARPADNTYHSAACRNQMEQRGFVEDVNAMRARFGMQPLR
jgi:hypothetical protein